MMMIMLVCWRMYPAESKEYERVKKCNDKFEEIVDECEGELFGFKEGVR